MNSFQLIEIICVCIIIGFQCYIFYSTRQRIALYKNIFPDAENFTIVKAALQKQYLNLHPSQILADLDKYIHDSKPVMTEAATVSDSGVLVRPAKYEDDARIHLDLIKNREGNEVTNKIIYTLNTYLIRNKGVASDFYLIKDVVERNTNAQEDDINQSISLPLYLGLLGTFLGIVFGLFQISGVDFASNPDALNNAISLLLGGVKIAMIASFMGLLLTVINSGVFFKGAKAVVEEKKNDFYTFIQIELLPLLNQNINSTLFSLQSNLHKFNDEFKDNIAGLKSVMGQNYDALIAQEKVLNALQKMDITEFAKANVKVLRELDLSIGKFAEFNKYLAGMNELVNNTKESTAKLNAVMERTNDFHALGRQVVNIFSESRELMKFLQSHYNSLDTSHQLITQAVNGVGSTLDDSLRKLKEFTQERITEVQKITLKEIDLMQAEYPEKWKRLDHLAYLETMSKNLNDIKMSNASQIGSVANEIRSVNEKLSEAVIELEAIKKGNANTFTSKISSSISKVFKKRVKA